MSTLAPTLQAFFTDRLGPAATGQPPHHRRLPGHGQAAAGLRRTTDRQVSLRYGHHRSGCTTDRRVPQPSGNRPRQQRPDPQRPAGGHTLAVPLLRVHHPQDAAVIARVLAIPPKRFDRAMIT